MTNSRRQKRKCQLSPARSTSVSTKLTSLNDRSVFKAAALPLPGFAVRDLDAEDERLEQVEWPMVLEGPEDTPAAFKASEVLLKSERDLTIFI